VTATESPHSEAANPAHEYCIALYDALKERATDDQFIGSITEVYKTLGISNQYYSRLLHGLIESGSVEYLQRGHHKRPTIYRLIHRPTKAELGSLDLLTPRTRRARVSEPDILRRLELLERRVRNVDIVAALQNLEKRIVALEKRK
jgi:hypothetical protein